MQSSLEVATPESLLRQEIRDLHAYHVPDSSGYIKLDAMENPHTLPAALQKEIASAVAAAPINRYPDPGAKLLKQKIRSAIQLPGELDILLGNGSDELIQLLALAVNKPGATLLSVEPSFVMYRMIAAFTGMRYARVLLTDGFSLDVAAMLAAIEREQPALIFLSYPNNPTGNLFPVNAMMKIIETAPGLVVVDEAYAAFASDSFLPRLSRYSNLLVMRTFSKLGMAGLRLGYLCGHRVWIEQLEKLRLPYNVGVLPQLVAGKLLEHYDVLQQQAEQIREERGRLHRQLSAMPDLRVYPSEANFLLFRVEDAPAVFNGLKQQGILIKNLDGSHPMLQNCLRVTVGTREENEQFLAALKSTL